MSQFLRSIHGYIASGVMFSVRDKLGSDETSNFETAKKWRDDGRLVLISGVGGYSITMVSPGGKNVEVNPCKSDSCKKVLDLYERGYRLKSTEYRGVDKKKDEPLERFTETLRKIADVLEPTNAQKAKYFREVKPYKQNQLWVVDYPSYGNAFARVKEEFEAAGKPSTTMTLYHGTWVNYIPSIMKRGLKPGKGKGFLGTGIYLGDIHKASGYTDLVILQCQVLLGKCKDLKEQEHMEDMKNEHYDSLHAARDIKGAWGGKLAHEEWIVRAGKQIEIYKVVCFAK